MTKYWMPAAALLLALAGPALAGQNPAATAPPKTPQAPAAPSVPLQDDRGAQDTRDRLRKLLEQYPPSVRQVLRIDTSLLSRPDYLATYPLLAAFLQQHPEVAHNPTYFIGSPDGASRDDWPRDARLEAIGAWRSFAEFIPVVAIVYIITSALAGIIRTLLDQRRWKRAAQMQMDVQNKLIDRFSGSSELLAYLQSPTGRGLTDSQAPLMMSMPFASLSRTMDAPINRIFWPLQAGIVVTAAGIGLRFLGRRIGFVELSEPVSGFASLVVAIGLGFIVSAGASYFLSHELGLVAPPPRPDAAHHETPGA